MLAGGASTLLLDDEQCRDQIGALARRERRALVAGTLCPCRRVSAHLNQLGRRIVAQPLAHLDRAARVAHCVVEGQARLCLIAPDHRCVEGRARDLTVDTRRPCAVGLTSSLKQGEAPFELGACTSTGHVFRYSECRARALLWKLGFSTSTMLSGIYNEPPLASGGVLAARWSPASGTVR
jgi:hypothetical protein